MASKDCEVDIFQCSKCRNVLDLESMTLPCLHSLCQSCLKVEALDNFKCPQCHETVTRGQLRLAPFLVKSLKRSQLESNKWWCYGCYERDSIYMETRFWCHGCQKFLCQKCQKYHSKFTDHETKDILGMERGEVIKFITTDECHKHRISKNTFCERCDVCLCDTCYEGHVTDSPQCPPRPLYVREEASNCKKCGPALEQELQDFEFRIRAKNAETKQSMKQLETDIDVECHKLWHDFDVFMEESRLKASNLCDNIRKMASDQLTKWHQFLKEREDLLEQVKIWRHTLPHLLMDNTDDEDVVCGVRSVRAKLSSRFHESVASAEKAHFVVTFPNWCHDSLDQLQKQTIDLIVESWHCRTLEEEKEWNVPGSKLDISSILVSDEDGHVFVSDWENKWIKEFRESGEFVGHCSLTDGGNTLSPQSMCFIPDDLIVVCGEFPLAKKLFFLQRNKSHPFLKIQRLIDTEKEYSALCQNGDKFLACDWKFDEIDCFSKNGQKMNTIKIERLTELPSNRPHICVDPTTGNLWGKTFGMSNIIVYNIQNRQNLPKVKIEGKSNFCVNKFGHCYYFTKEKIVSALPEQVLYNFQKNVDFPLTFASTKKLFVCCKDKIKEIYFMKIFKIRY